MFHLVTKKVLAGVRQDLQKPSAYLLPIRLFIGIGWIRASLEKFTTSGWPQGIVLKNFLHQHLSSGSVVFPFYKNLIANLFAPNALILSWIIMVGQLLVGLAILSGTLTGFALLWGVFMNLNFILAGEITPSAFYIVIQVILFVSSIGAVLGLDKILSRRIPFVFLCAQSCRNNQFWRSEKGFYLLSTLIAAVAAVAAIPYIRYYGPNSVEDPAMLVFILSFVIGMVCYITGSRIHPQQWFTRYLAEKSN